MEHVPELPPETNHGRDKTSDDGEHQHGSEASQKREEAERGRNRQGERELGRHTHQGDDSPFRELPERRRSNEVQIKNSQVSETTVWRKFRADAF